MNTPLYSTKTRKPKTDIEYVNYNSIEEIINDLFLASTLPHDEYDSVKLYGDSKFILSVFHHIISNEKYSDITIASVDIISSAIDPACRDDYVLILYDGELYIQSSWNDKYDRPFENDAKFTICQYGIPRYILRNVVKSNTPVKVCNLEIS